MTLALPLGIFSSSPVSGSVLSNPSPHLLPYSLGALASSSSGESHQSSILDTLIQLFCEPNGSFTLGEGSILSPLIRDAPLKISGPVGKTDLSKALLALRVIRDTSESIRRCCPHWWGKHLACSLLREGGGQVERGLVQRQVFGCGGVRSTPLDVFSSCRMTKPGGSILAEDLVNKVVELSGNERSDIVRAHQHTSIHIIVIRARGRGDSVETPFG